MTDGAGGQRCHTRLVGGSDVVACEWESFPAMTTDGAPQKKWPGLVSG
jgi:hypothetical protein